MSRRKAAAKRKVLPDPLFKSQLLTKFINVVMTSGKKSVAEKIVYDALEKLVEKYKGDKSGITLDKEFPAADKIGSIKNDDAARHVALEIFDKGLASLRPTVEVRSRRVGGANYQVPVEVPVTRGLALAMRWLVEFANKRSEKTMALRLANEILDALSGKGGAVKKRETVHSMAKANLAFAHFRW
jgi:small subunit ribosomal protein S7